MVFAMLGFTGFALADSGPPATVSAAATTTAPIRAAFYYPWYPENWQAGQHFHPTLGLYSTDSPDILNTEFKWMHYAGMNAAISSWWGQGQHNEQWRFPQELKAAVHNKMTVTPYYEKESVANQSVAEIQSDLTYLKKYETANPAGFLQVDGKPVIFVYNALPATSTCAEVDKWAQATNNFTDWYVNLKVFAGYQNCATQPSSWHQYGPASAQDAQLPYSFSASPGYWKYNEASPRLARDPARWKSDVSAMATSGAQWQLVTSWNEWGEGTSVESATEWAQFFGYGTYVNTLHNVLVNGNVTPPPPPPPPPTNQPPTAAFTDTTSGDTVNVDGSGSNDPDGSVASYDWNWGDGSADGSGATATHTYAKDGTYTVTLTVTDNQGATGTTTHSVTLSTTQPPPPPPPGSNVTKVLTFVEENHTLTSEESGMPNLFGLAKQYGYANHWAAITHPSLPNYLAIAGGSTYGVSDDDSPSAHPISGASVFGQAIAQGKTAKTYAEGMPSNCDLNSGGNAYAVKHNPWAYFTAERSLCNQFDVPETALAGDVTAGTLPNVGMVIPNLNDDAHDGSLAQADSWLKTRLNEVMAGPDWKSGHLAIVVTTDENDGSSGNIVLTVVLHSSQSGHVVSTPLTHYSLTRFLEDVVGATHQNNAATAPDMATAFGLPLS